MNNGGWHPTEVVLHLSGGNQGMRPRGEERGGEGVDRALLAVMTYAPQ